MASVIDRPDAKSTRKPLTRQEIEELSTELHGTPLAEELKQIAGWLKDTEDGQQWMDLIIPTVEKWTDGETVTYHIISSAWRRRHHDWELKKSKSIYDADGNLIPDGRGVENMWEDLIQRLQQGITPKVPADSDLAKYMAEHPDASVHRIEDTYTVFPQNLNGVIERFDLGGKHQENTTRSKSARTMTQDKKPTKENLSHGPEIPANSDLEKYLAEHPDATVLRLRFTYTVTGAGADGEIVIFDLNGKRYDRPAQQRSPVMYEPGTYAPANLSSIPADSDLGKILREYPDAKVRIYIHKGKRSYSATWGTYPWGGPKFMGSFDMSGHEIQTFQFKSAAFKSGQVKVQDKKTKKEKVASDILATHQAKLIKGDYNG